MTRPAAYLLCVLALLLAAPAAAKPPPVASLPHLERLHGATQLVVNGAPFLMLGGELYNSDASSLATLDTLWPRLAAMHFNTVLAPAYWELIEPQEGRFDFRTVDGLIAGARKHHMHVVLLWFGSWKNSMSTYAPAWVKRDTKRFPRARASGGRALDILSAFAPANLQADARAFAALMQHLRATDRARTVVMVQVENEVGMIPEARDHGPLAEAAFAAPVPKALTDYLAAHFATLDPALKAAWQNHGRKTGKNWAATFGVGLATDEIFTAWSEGRYTDRVAARGKAVYPLPMYVNAALVRPGKLPGRYPSGGPLPHLFDVWHAAAPSIDLLAPDLYFPNFVEWAKKYDCPGNPMFIPETGRVSAAHMAANAFYAFGALDAMGFSPYAPEFLDKGESETLGAAYDVLGQLAPFILANQGTGRMAGVTPPVAFDGTADLAPQHVTLGDYAFDVRFKKPAPISVGAAGEPELPGAHGGLIIERKPGEFLIAGTGMIVFFAPKDGKGSAGIESVWEGRFVNGQWVPGRLLNGDDTNQGRELPLPSGKFTIRKVRLYRYR